MRPTATPMPAWAPTLRPLDGDESGEERTVTVEVGASVPVVELSGDDEEGEEEVVSLFSVEGRGSAEMLK